MWQRILILTGLLLAITPASARIINVPDDFQTIQAGIDAAEDGDTVLVAPGIYEENLIIHSGIVLASRFIIDGNPELVNSTPIDGGNNGSVVTIGDVDRGEVSIIGLSLRNGDYRYGGGISAFVESNLSLSHLMIENNHAGDSGGGALAWADTLRVDNVIFRNNSSDFDGGGLDGVANRGYIQDCEFSNNHARAWGGGLSLSGNFDLARCKVSGNETGWEELTGNGCAILFFNNGSLRVMQTTVAGNNSQLYESAILVLPPYRNAMQVEFLNSIIFNDVEFQIVVDRDSSFIPTLLSIHYSDLLGGEDGISIRTFPQDSVSVDWGEGNIDADPLFSDPENGDYHLTADSPCIDAGDPESPLDPDGSRADMGAFYFHQRDIEVEPVALEFAYVQTGTTDSLALTIRNVGLTPLTLYPPSIEPDDAPFHSGFEGDSLVVEPESATALWVYFSPEEEAEYRAELLVISDDFDEDTVTVALIGSALSVSGFILHPSSFILSISPNPFNALARVEFTLPRAGLVELEVYDVRGVRVIQKGGHYASGRHQVTIEGDGLASGEYLVRLSDGRGQVRMGKAVLAR